MENNETYAHKYLVQTFYPNGDLAGFTYYDDHDLALAAFRGSRQTRAFIDCRTDVEKYPHLTPAEIARRSA